MAGVVVKKAEGFVLRNAYKSNFVPKLSLKLLLLGLIGFYACLLLCWHLSPLSQSRSSTTTESPSKKLLVHDFSSSALPKSSKYNKKKGGKEKSRAATAPTTNIWDNAKTLPHWMKDYFAWHQEQRAQLNENNWQQYKYIVMQCTQQDRHCGGTADRLKPIPMVVLLGHLQQRILMIHWESPKPLEEFLLPPIGGVDWRMPFYLVPEIGFKRPALNSDKGLLQAMTEKTNDISWNVRYQTYHSGSQFYNTYKPNGSPPFDQIYHELWRMLFTPSPPVARLILDVLHRHHLVPGQYAAAHVRAQYSVYMERPKPQTRLLTQNALNCASTLYPGAPIFVASDDPFAIQVARNYGVRKGGTIIARYEVVDTTHASTVAAPLHLELAKNATARRAEDYYDTFVDFYLMGLSRCVTYNKGGFGHWALLISYNVSCKLRHQVNNNFTFCNWTNTTSTQLPPTPERTMSSNTRQQPIFLPPMID